MKIQRLVKQIDLEDSVPRLIEIACDKNRIFENRRDSIEVLGTIKDKRAVVPLIGLLDDDDIFYHAIRALGKIGDERAIEPIIRFLESNKWSMELLIKELERRGYGEKLIMKPTDILSFSESSRNPGIEALGEIGGKKSIAVLMNLLKQNPRDLTIVRALGAAKAKEAVPSLNEMLEREGKSYLGSVIIETLGNIGTDEAIEILIKRYPWSCWYRVWYIKALGNSKNRKAIPFLEEVLSRGNEFDAELAATALKKITGREYKYKR